MSVSEEELEKMYRWIINSMKVDIWYPVKSEKAYAVLLKLFNEGLIDFCEFNSKETHLRKIYKELLKD